MKLHLGCGKRHIPGFVHVDLNPFPHVDYVQDIRKLAQFGDETVDLVYASQVLEYFDRFEVVDVLREWTRVLKRGGILRLSVPNFEVLSRLYQAGFSLDYFVGTLFGRWESGGQVIYHRMTYDEPTLTRYLADAGYVDIKHWRWQETEHGDVDDFSQAYFPHMDKERGIQVNLNMQGVKA